MQKMKGAMEPTVPFYAAEFVAMLPGHEQPTTPGSLQGQKRDQRSFNAEDSKRKISLSFQHEESKDRQVKVTRGMTYGISPCQQFELPRLRALQCFPCLYINFLQRMSS